MVNLPHRQVAMMPGMKRPAPPPGPPGHHPGGMPGGPVMSKSAKKKKKLADKILPQKVRELVPESQVRIITKLELKPSVL